MELQIDLGMSTKVRWYHGSHPVEPQNNLGCSQGKDDFKLPNPTELQIDLACPQWNFKLTWAVHKGTMISNFPQPWKFPWVGWYRNSTRMEFQIGSGVPAKKMISNFPFLWNSTLTWHVQKRKKISNLPPPWNFKLPWHVQKGRTMS